jgi:ParB-like chromosome segregation protein Spo0J
MADAVQMAFKPEGILVPIGQILPVRTVRPEMRKGQQYQRLFASIRELGVIEPLIIFPQDSSDGRDRRYTLLDGHFRLDVLKELGRTEAFCLIAKDDEGFTYNHKVNRMAPIQEHFMILRALDNGVTEERIAATLSVDVKSIRLKRDLLTGICPEAVVLLKDKNVTTKGLRELKRAVPMRQIEMAELMVAANNFSTDTAPMIPSCAFGACWGCAIGRGVR